MNIIKYNTSRWMESYYRRSETSASVRGKGVGTELIKWAIQRAEEHGCHLVQLTTDKKRPDALRFYERLGFKATHEGLKLKI